MRIQKLAEQLSAAFETKKRNDEKEFVCLKDGSPSWMTEVIRAAHGDKLPDDTTYAFVEKAADAIADSEDPQEAILEIEPDAYTAGLTAWLNARVDHVYYLTETLDEIAQAGLGITDGFQVLALAQQKQIQEVGNALISALEAQAELDADIEGE